MSKHENCMSHVQISALDKVNRFPRSQSMIPFDVCRVWPIRVPTNGSASCTRCRKCVRTCVIRKKIDFCCPPSDKAFDVTHCRNSVRTCVTCSKTSCCCLPPDNTASDVTHCNKMRQCLYDLQETGCFSSSI